jgi:hypothetical protein
VCEVWRDVNRDSRKRNPCRVQTGSSARHVSSPDARLRALWMAQTMATEGYAFGARTDGRRTSDSGYHRVCVRACPRQTPLGAIRFQHNRQDVYRRWLAEYDDETSLLLCGVRR